MDTMYVPKTRQKLKKASQMTGMESEADPHYEEKDPHEMQLKTFEDTFTEKYEC